MSEVLSGTLGQVTIASLLQLVESDGLTGMFHAFDCTLRFHDGVLVGADFFGLSGSKAAVEALVRASGAFKMVAEHVPPGNELIPLHSLIMDGFHIMDELQRFGPMVLPSGAIPKLLPADGERSVAQIVLKEKLHLTKVIPSLLKLQNDGQLSPVSIGAPIELEMLHVVGELKGKANTAPTPPPKPVRKGPAPTFDDLVFEARRLTRQRRLTEAEQLLKDALSLNPDSRIVQQNLRRVRTLREQY